jgi:uncharacterized protein (DUF1697 family)
MAVVISMLRGVNVGTHHRIKMVELRALYESLRYRDVQTYVQSGNVIFRGSKASAGAIEEAIERAFGFRPAVILRTAAELREAIAWNPFPNVDPSRLLVVFLASDPGEAARQRIRAIPAEPEELRANGRELYIHYPNGMARPKLSMAAVEKSLKVAGTGRNWNTVTKLLQISEAMEAAR